MRRRLGLYLFWGGLFLTAAYSVLSLLGPWELTQNKIYSWAKDFFTGPNVPIPLRIAIPALILGVILLLIPKRKAAK